METHLHPKFPMRLSRYRSRRPFAPGTQERSIYIQSSRRSRLGIEAVDHLHQEPKEDRFTPQGPEEVV